MKSLDSPLYVAGEGADVLRLGLQGGGRKGLDRACCRVSAGETCAGLREEGGGMWTGLAAGCRQEESSQGWLQGVERRDVHPCALPEGPSRMDRVRTIDQARNVPDFFHSLGTLHLGR